MSLSQHHLVNNKLREKSLAKLRTLAATHEIESIASHAVNGNIGVEKSVGDQSRNSTYACHHEYVINTDTDEKLKASSPSGTEGLELVTQQTLHNNNELTSPSSLSLFRECRVPINLNDTLRNDGDKRGNENDMFEDLPETSTEFGQKMHPTASRRTQEPRNPLVNDCRGYDTNVKGGLPSDQRGFLRKKCDVQRRLSSGSIFEERHDFHKTEKVSPRHSVALKLNLRLTDSWRKMNDSSSSFAQLVSYAPNAAAAAGSMKESACKDSEKSDGQFAFAQLRMLKNQLTERLRGKQKEVARLTAGDKFGENIESRCSSEDLSFAIATSTFLEESTEGHQGDNVVNNLFGFCRNELSFNDVEVIAPHQRDFSYEDSLPQDPTRDPILLPQQRTFFELKKTISSKNRIDDTLEASKNQIRERSIPLRRVRGLSLPKDEYENVEKMFYVDKLRKLAASHKSSKHYTDEGEITPNDAGAFIDSPKSVNELWLFDQSSNQYVARSIQSTSWSTQTSIEDISISSSSSTATGSSLATLPIENLKIPVHPISLVGDVDSDSAVYSRDEEKMSERAKCTITEWITISEEHSIKSELTSKTGPFDLLDYVSCINTEFGVKQPPITTAKNEDGLESAYENFGIEQVYCENGSKFGDTCNSIPQRRPIDVDDVSLSDVSQELLQNNVDNSIESINFGIDCLCNNSNQGGGFHEACRKIGSHYLLSDLLQTYDDASFGEFTDENDDFETDDNSTEFDNSMDGPALDEDREAATMKQPLLKTKAIRLQSVLFVEPGVKNSKSIVKVLG